MFFCQAWDTMRPRTIKRANDIVKNILIGNCRDVYILWQIEQDSYISKWNMHIDEIETEKKTQTNKHVERSSNLKSFSVKKNTILKKYQVKVQWLQWSAAHKRILNIKLKTRALVHAKAKHIHYIHYFHISLYPPRKNSFESSATGINVLII